MTAFTQWIKDSRFAMGMLVVQLIATGFQILSRVILRDGTTFVVALMVYRNIIGAVCVAPFALSFERGGGKRLCWQAVFWLFMVALTGISMATGLYYYGLRDTTATYAANFLNLIPVATFIFSILLRIENLQMHTFFGKVKVIGAAICFGGAVTTALYKGKSFYVGHSFIHHSNSILKEVPKHWTRGTILLVCSFLVFGLWYISQAKLYQVFPYKFYATFYTCAIATLQQVVAGLCMNRTKVAWHLEWNLQLVTIVYSGALATAASFCLTTWTVGGRGPTYPSMFNPLALVFVAVTEALFLGEPVTVGSLISMSLILIGLYMFLWGKNQERKSEAAAKTEAASESKPTSSENIVKEGGV